MKITFKFTLLQVVFFFSILLMTVSSCSEELAFPTAENQSIDSHITSRTDGPVSTQVIKQKVSVRDNIPLNEILTCYYYGQTDQGYYEYRLTTQYNGPKVYFVTQIIGDINDGF